MWFIGRIAFVILVFVLFYYFIGSFKAREIVVEPIPEQEKVVAPLEDTLLQSEISKAASKTVYTDVLQTYRPHNMAFLYEEAENATIPQSKSDIDNYNQALAASVFYQKLEELDAAEPDDADVEPEEGATPTETSEQLDKIYEEKLPDDVIVEDIAETTISPEMMANGYHIYHRRKDIKQMDVEPNFKPPYFGELPVIAIVIDDMGVSQKRTRDITSLKAPLTASFLTYGRNLEPQVNDALAAGQEVMAHTPMQAHSNADTAPDVLTIAMSTDEVKAGLNIMLDKFHNIKGINNHMGSRLTEDLERMDAVMEILKERGLFFLDSKTSAFSVAKQAARRNGVAYATRHVFLDNENNVDYIKKQLAIAERIARRNGYAVAIGHPKTGTYKALKEWLPGLNDKQIRLVPLSEIVNVLYKSHI